MEKYDYFAELINDMKQRNDCDWILMSPTDRKVMVEIAKQTRDDLQIFLDAVEEWEKDNGGNYNNELLS